MKFMTVLLAVFAFLALLGSHAYAEGEAQPEVATDPREKLEQELLLTLPEETENPNFSITFTDPSGQGVHLTIDSQSEITINNPYTLPSLGIGEHILKFRFTDKSGSEQTVEDILIITPRPTELKAPEIVDGRIRVSGEAVALAEIQLFISGGKLTERGEALVGDDGVWVHTFEGEFTPGIYTVVAYVKKGGFASNYSEPKTFQIDDGTSDPVENVDTPQDVRFTLSDFAFSDLSVRGLASDIKNNPQSGAFLGAFVLFGVITGMILVAVFARGKDKSAEKMLKEAFASKGQSGKKNEPAPKAEEKPSIANKLGKKDADSKKEDKKGDEPVKQDKEKHLEIDLDKEVKGKDKKEKKAEAAPDKPEKKESLSEKLKKAELELSKDEFLKEYQAYDPDPKKGTKAEKDQKKKQEKPSEKPVKKDKSSKNEKKESKDSTAEDRNIKITLTSESLGNDKSSE